MIVGAAEMTAIQDQNLPSANSRIGVSVRDANNPDASRRVRRGIGFNSEDDTQAFAAHLIEMAEDQAVEFAQPAYARSRQKRSGGEPEGENFDQLEQSADERRRLRVSAERRMDDRVASGQPRRQERRKARL
ncbi:hypothetical protein [Brevundimonas mediterranea]|uniref:hypothetical protein n=1 Tax=Brevundimonas mediterranea TaxID=74329 RepID=UPI0040342220